VNEPSIRHACTPAANPTRFWPYVILCIVFLLLEIFTRSLFFADTMIYVEEIQSSAACPSINECPQIWDAGHLLWRPAGHFLAPMVLPSLKWVEGGDDRMAITLLLTIMSDSAIFVTTLFLYSILTRVTGTTLAPLFLTTTFLCTNAILDTLHSGTPYGVGLAFLAGAIWKVQEASESGRIVDALLAGLLGALAVSFWIPYFVALPALLCWLVINGKDRRRQMGVGMVAAAAVTGALLFGLGAHFRGVDSVSDFRIWFNGSGHGTEQNRNLIRSLFGLPRSFLNMGQVGSRLKQFLFKDPYANVNLASLFWFSLWKIGLFYAALMSLIFLYRVPQGRRALLICGVAFLPTMVLAVAFEGGSAERYLPLYPFLFIAAAECLCHPKVPRLARVFLILFFLVTIVTNVPAFSAGRIRSEQDRAAKRINPLLPLRPASYVYVVGRDEIGFLRYDAPFHEINRGAKFEVQPVYMPMIRTAYWKHDFAAKVLSVWALGGDVWVTTRVFYEQPRREWEWVEGDDPNITWKGIVDFFRPFAYGKAVGGEDGFVLLLHSPENQNILRPYLNN
jgi:hypothetical protein